MRLCEGVLGKRGDLLKDRSGVSWYCGLLWSELSTQVDGDDLMDKQVTMRENSLTSQRHGWMDQKREN